MLILSLALYLISFDSEILNIILFRVIPSDLSEISNFILKDFSSVIHLYSSIRIKTTEKIKTLLIKITNLIIRFIKVAINKIVKIVQCIIAFFFRHLNKVIIIGHYLNPLSIIRVNEILTIPLTSQKQLELLCQSAWFIFLDYFFLLMYCFNLLFPLSFVQYHKKFWNKQWNYQVISNCLDEEDKIFFEKCQKYFYFAQEICLNNFKENLFFLIGVIISLPSFLIVWRIKRTFQIIVDFSQNRQINIFLLKNVLNANKGLIHLLSAITSLENYIFFGFNFKIISEIRAKNGKLSFLVINLFLFIQKIFDFLYQIISLIQVHTFFFIVYKLPSTSLIERMFPLFLNQKILNSIHLEKLDEQEFYNQISLSYHQRRSKFIQEAFYKFFYNFLIVFNFIFGFLDPFSFLQFSQEIFHFVYICYNPQSQVNSDNNQYLVKNKEKFETQIIIDSIDIVLDFCFFIPANLLLIQTGPWCSKPPFLYFWNKAKRNFNRIIHYDISYDKELSQEKYKNILLSKFNEIVKKTYNKWVNGYKILIKFLLIHLCIVRAGYMWYDYFTRKSSLSSCINKHFIHVYTEFFFIPILPFFLIVCIFEPWNIYLIHKFFLRKKSTDKIYFFFSLIVIIVIDIFTLLMILILFFSIIETAPCVLLIIRNLNIICSTNKNSMAFYESKYQYIFRKQVLMLFLNFFKKIYIILCILLNFLLLYRIPIIIKRIKLPVKQYLNKTLNDFSTFIKSFKQNNINTYEKSKIEKIPQVVFISICSFLDAPSLSKLSAGSKSLSLKALSYLIWKEKYETIYIKHLKKVLSTYEFVAFSPEKYGHYKEV